MSRRFWLALVLGVALLLALVGTAAAQGPTPPAQVPPPPLPAQGAQPSTGVAPQAAPGPTFTYCVRPGDTLYGIATRYGTTVQVIMNLNSLTSTVIYPGQCLQIPTGPTPPPPPSGDIIVDDTSPNFVRGGDPGGWRTAAAGYRSRMYWTFNNQVQQPAYNYGQWFARVPAGNYEVFAFIPRINAFTRNAVYGIKHADGLGARAVNQALYYDQWVSLGTYRFAGDGTEYVWLNDITGETRLSVRIGYDAVRFSRR